jgi:DNA polymerase-3 subunit epsilon
LYSIVDIETTGGLASTNSITEIAILVHDGNSVVKEFQTLVNPQQPITPFVTRLTGISNAMVASAPLFGEIAEEVYAILHDKIFVAHNVQFDFSYIDQQLKNSGYILKTPRLCTVQMSRKFIPGMESYSLGKLCRSLGITVEDRHRALGDARATAVLFEKILQNGGASHISKNLKNKKIIN